MVRGSAFVELQELMQLLHGKSRQTMVLGFGMVDFMNGDCGMDMLLLNRLFVDDRLNNLVDVMVVMLSNNLRCMFYRMSRWESDQSVAEMRSEFI